MDVHEFKQRYGYYRADSQGEAEAEAAKVNEEGVEGDMAIALKWGLVWTIRLKIADRFAVALFG